MSRVRAPSSGWIYTLAALMVLFWSANFIVGKIALREFPPVLLASLRIGLAGVLIAPLYLWERRGGAPVARKDWPELLVLGMLGVTLNQLCFAVGLRYTSVAHSSLLIGLTPLCVLLIAVATRVESFTTAKVLGMVLALAGVAVLQTGKEQGGPPATMFGDLLNFMAAFTFALFTVFGKRASTRYSSITMNTFAYVGGAIALLPAMIWGSRQISYARITPAAWASLFYMALFPSVICYLIYYYVLQRISASRLAAITYLEPLIATLMAAPILGERVTLPVVISGVMIVGGVFLTERTGRREPVEARS